MHPFFTELSEHIPLTGNARTDMLAFLGEHGYQAIADHSLQVAEAAYDLAWRFGATPAWAGLAGWLHDVSAVVPVERRVQLASELGLEVLPEEESFPLLLHQKLSAVMARQIFGVVLPEVLSAISCHTTLKPGASRLDLVVFVGDKLAWDGDGKAPFHDAMQEAIAVSIEQAARVYIDHLWQERQEMEGPLHPWFLAARKELGK